MTKKYVPIKKQSKKAQKEYYSQKRLDWGTVNPVSKEYENDRRFNKSSRSRSKADLRKRNSFCRMLK